MTGEQTAPAMAGEPARSDASSSDLKPVFDGTPMGKGYGADRDAHYDAEISALKRDVSELRGIVLGRAHK